MVTKIRPKEFQRESGPTYAELTHSLEEDAPALLHAVAAEDHESIRDLLSKGADINATDEDDRTALHIAIFTDNADVAEILIHHGADVNATTNSWKETPLHDATTRQTIQVLVENGADVNARDLLGQTSLHKAAIRSSLPTQVLLDKGADVNALDKDGDTPLHKLMRENPKEQGIQEILLFYGADETIRNKQGLTPQQCSGATQRGLTVRQEGPFRGNNEAKFKAGVALAVFGLPSKTIRRYLGINSQAWQKWQNYQPYKLMFQMLEAKYRARSDFANDSPQREQKLHEIQVDCGVRLLLRKKDFKFLRKLSIFLDAAAPEKDADAVVRNEIEKVAATVDLDADQFQDALLKRLDISQ